MSSRAAATTKRKTLKLVVFLIDFYAKHYLFENISNPLSIYQHHTRFRGKMGDRSLQSGYICASSSLFFYKIESFQLLFGIKMWASRQKTKSKVAVCPALLN